MLLLTPAGCRPCEVRTCAQPAHAVTVLYQCGTLSFYGAWFARACLLLHRSALCLGKGMQHRPGVLKHSTSGRDSAMCAHINGRCRRTA